MCSSDLPYAIRTFEVEELVDGPSFGLGEDRFGCRYAHAEYDLEHSHVSHFDGAIRAYAADPYLDRLDLSIDRAGKQADYTKLFRLDGALAVAAWKRLLSDFYRGNALIPEYLGAPADIASDEDPPRPRPKGKARVPALAALITLDLDVGAPCRSTPQVLASHRQTFGTINVRMAQIGPGAVAELLAGWLEDKDSCHLSFQDGRHDLSTIEDRKTHV